MPKNKVQDAVFTAIMAILMVYGMIVYNVALNTPAVSQARPFCLPCMNCPLWRRSRLFWNFSSSASLQSASHFRS